MADFKITESTEKRFLVLGLHGKIDAESSPALIRKLNEAIAAGKVWIILDLRMVSFMSSAGIGATVKALNDTRSRKGDLRISGIRDDVKKVYQLLGFAAAFKFFANTSEAASA